jgi:hypothetical protein
MAAGDFAAPFTFISRLTSGRCSNDSDADCRATATMSLEPGVEQAVPHVSHGLPPQRGFTEVGAQRGARRCHTGRSTGLLQTRAR